MPWQLSSVEVADPLGLEVGLQHSKELLETRSPVEEKPWVWFLHKCNWKEKGEGRERDTKGGKREKAGRETKWEGEGRERDHEGGEGRRQGKRHRGRGREGMRCNVHDPFYHGCFEWANQIAQKEVDKSLNFINLQVQIQGCMAHAYTPL